MKNLTLTFVFLLLICGMASAQTQVSPNILQWDESSPRPQATLQDAAWIVGQWTGEGLDGTCEEIWAPAYNNHMVGTFRMIKTEKFKFFAFADIAEVDNTLSMRVKHFTYDLKGWENKEGYKEFRLVKVAKNKLYFDGLTMVRIGDNQMEVFMTIKYKEGVIKEEKYSYKKLGTLNTDPSPNSVTSKTK